MSTKWIGAKDKDKFRCLTCGHEWSHKALLYLTLGGQLDAIDALAAKQVNLAYCAYIG
jgi:hypothetical protein